METRVLYGLVVMLMYLVGSGFSQGEVQSGEAEWERFLIDAKQPILLTLTSSLCGVPCVLLENQVAQLAKTHGNQYHILFYQADILKKPFFARLYKVLHVPTLIVFNLGKEIKRLEKDFYWGAVYDLIFKANILYPAPSPAPSDSAPPPFLSQPSNALLEVLEDLEPWLKSLDEAQHPIVVMVTSSLCGAPCAILEDQVVQLAKTFGDRIIFFRNNYLENPFFAKLYNILDVPAVIVFKDGKVIIRYENLSDCGGIYELIFHSTLIGSAPSPSDSDDALPLAPQSGE